MALVKVYLDPNAAAYTDDEIVGKVNTATANITRASSVAAAARPIAAGEVTDTELGDGAVKAKLAAETDGNKLTSSELAAAIANAQVATGLAKANLDAMADLERAYVKTNPVAGQKKVVFVQLHSDGKIEWDANDIAE